jgi:hypothetical protein
MKLSDIPDLVEANEYLVYDKEFKLAVTFDRQQNADHGETAIRRIFRVKDNGDVEELPVEQMIDKLAGSLVHTIDVRALLKKIIGEMPPGKMIKAHELITKDPDIAKRAKALPGCMFIRIEDPAPGEDPIDIGVRF